MCQLKLYYVYMLRCSDGTYYIGITSELEKRIGEHQFGTYTSCYTFKRRPVELVWSAEHTEVLDAIQCEKKLKGWSHGKKTALTVGDFEAIRELARSHTSTSSA